MPYNGIPKYIYVLGSRYRKGPLKFFTTKLAESGGGKSRMAASKLEILISYHTMCKSTQRNFQHNLTDICTCFKGRQHDCAIIIRILSDIKISEKSKIRPTSRSLMFYLPLTMTSDRVCTIVQSCYKTPKTLI